MRPMEMQVQFSDLQQASADMKVQQYIPVALNNNVIK